MEEEEEESRQRAKMETRRWRRDAIRHCHSYTTSPGFMTNDGEKRWRSFLPYERVLAEQDLLLFAVLSLGEGVGVALRLGLQTHPQVRRERERAGRARLRKKVL